MMRSLYSGVSGLRNHQTRMDVIGNNIANVNTVGFKASRTIFQDLYSQNMRSASSPGETTGGTNPQQIGLGMTLSTIDTLFTRSAAQVTGNTYDLMIENDGFFVVRNGFGASYEEYYTRAGNFYEDKEHYLVTANGFYLQGYKSALQKGADPVQGNATALDATNSTLTGKARAGTAAKVSTPSGAGISNVKNNVDSAAVNGYTINLTAADLADPTNLIVNVEVLDAAGAPVAGGTTTINLAAYAGASGTASINVGGVDISFTIGADTTPAMMDSKSFTIDKSGVNPHLAGGAAFNGSTAISFTDRGSQNNGYSYEITVKDASKREITVVTKNEDGYPVGSTTVTLPDCSDGTDRTVTVADMKITMKGNYNIWDMDGVVIATDNSGVDTTKLGEPYYSITSEMDRIYVDENLYNISIDKNGNVTGIVKADGVIRDPSTGENIQVLAEQRVVIGRVAVATFDNQQALDKVGSNLYRTTANTGEAQYKYPGSDGAGQINPGALEMSNVDLAQEFTDMIVTQRGFQANSRIITVSDTLLEELINLKR